MQRRKARQELAQPEAREPSERSRKAGLAVTIMNSPLPQAGAQRSDNKKPLSCFFANGRFKMTPS
jgi:hypothetical protein